MNMRRARPVKMLSTPRRFTIARAWIMIVLIAATLVVGLLAMRPTFLAPRSTPPSVDTTAANVASSSATPGFLLTAENTTRPSGPAPDGMVWIPGGEFSMGAQDPTDMHDAVGMQATKDSRPVHRVYVDGFWMDATEVTNAQFASFVKATGYVTVAERKPRAEDFPGARPEDLVPGSVMFSPPSHAVPLDQSNLHGGRTSPARTGVIRPVRRVRSGEGSMARRSRRVRRRARVRAVGRQAAADRSGVGVCGARRLDRAALPVGQYAQGLTAGGWPTPIKGTFPTTTRARTRSRESRRSAQFPRERLRAPRRRRQRVGVGQRLVSPGLLPATGGHRGVARNPQGPADSFDPDRTRT